MKKFIYLMLALVGFAACQPMDDIYDELEANEPAISNGDEIVTYTLTEEDYDDLDLSFGNFSSLEDARALIPQVLSSRYPVLGQGSNVTANFLLYDPIRVVDNTVTADDYTAMGLSDGYFTSAGDVEEFLEMEYPQAADGDYVSLTYMALANEIMYMLTDADFELIGEELAEQYPGPAASAAQYGNFERRDGNAAFWSNDMIVEAIGFVLSEEFEDVAGQKYNVSYAIYNGSAGTESTTVQFDGNAYVAVGGTAYELNGDDYDYIGSEFATTYPGPSENAARFNSFDVRPSSGNYWSNAMLLEAFNAVLKNQEPDAAEGTQFEITYAIYDGAVSSRVMGLVLEGDDYVIDDEASVSTIEVTEVYAFANGNWDIPYTISAEEYTEMGQNFPNFSDEDEAIYKIGILLEDVYKYAEPGYFATVAYDLFEDGSAETEYANYTFDGDSWIYIPSVVEQSIQFGYDNGTWVPDNTINYRLGADEYAYIVSQLSEKYPDPTSSMDRYGNLDRRPGNAAEWDDEMVLEAMNVLLDGLLAPNAEVGQKYVLTFDIYNGSNTTETIRLIKDPDNLNYEMDWVPQDQD